jgi:tripartite-type tricarboxylate transporter receptor subunit TctC
MQMSQRNKKQISEVIQMKKVWRAFWRITLVPSLLVLAALFAGPGGASAQGYPNRTVKIIVPFPAGGSADVLPRIVAEWLSKKWGQPVVIENISGAGGNIGAAAAFGAPPDGYTLFSAPPPPLAINQNLYPKLNFDPTAFEPIVIMAIIPNALLVNPDKVKANTVAEFISYMKANPMKLNAGTQGNGTTSHLTLEMFQMMAQVKAQAVPYRGSAPAMQALIAGDIDFMFDNLGVTLAQVHSGKLKLIATATAKRLASLPQVPTIAETLPGFESAAWYAFVAPPKTPKAIVDKLNVDINEALRDASVRERLAKLSAEPVGGSVQSTAAYIKADTARWEKVIKAAHVTLQ